MDHNTLVNGVISLALYGIIAYSMLIAIGASSYLIYRPRRGDKKVSNFELVIVSKADHKVKNSLLESINYHLKLYGKTTVVVDEGAPLTSTLKKIKGLHLIEVPRTYRRDLVGKGRALQYFVDCCVDPEKWYVFIDDDNLLLDDSFLYEIPVYEREGYVAANGILVPRPGRSSIAHVMDWIRFMDDVLLYRFFTGLLGKPLLGLHGDLLIVKGRVLKEIGFNVKTFTEDFEFAANLVRRGYRTWQSATRVSIKSPNSIRDLVRQRGRWFRGLMSGIRRCPWSMRLIIILRSFTFSVGFLVIALFLPVISYLGWLWFIIPSGIYYLGTYTYGVYKSRKPYLILFLPIYGLLEATSRLYGVIVVNSYVVIDKN